MILDEEHVNMLRMIAEFLEVKNSDDITGNHWLFHHLYDQFFSDADRLEFDHRIFSDLIYNWHNPEERCCFTCANYCLKPSKQVPYRGHCSLGRTINDDRPSQLLLMPWSGCSHWSSDYEARLDAAGDPEFEEEWGGHR